MEWLSMVFQTDNERGPVTHGSVMQRIQMSKGQSVQSLECRLLRNRRWDHNLKYAHLSDSEIKKDTGLPTMWKQRFARSSSGSTWTQASKMDEDGPLVWKFNKDTKDDRLHFHPDFDTVRGVFSAEGLCGKPIETKSRRDFELAVYMD